VGVAFENEGSEDETDDRLAYARSADGGATFGDAAVLPEGAEGQPALAVNGAVVHLFGCSGSDPARSELHLYRSRDGGRTFSGPVNVSQSPGDSEEPSIAVDSVTGDVHLVWSEEPPEPDEGQAQPAAEQAWLEPRTSVNAR